MKQVFDTSVGTVEVHVYRDSRTVSITRFDDQRRAVAATFESWDHVDLRDVLTRQIGVAHGDAGRIAASVREQYMASDTLAERVNEAVRNERHPSGFVTVERGYASWGSRVVAYLIDVLIATVIATMGLALGIAGNSMVLAVVLMVGAYIGYFVVGHGSASGQTLGKKSMAIAVRNADGRRIGYGVAFWRVVATWLIGLIPLAAVVDVLAPWWDSRNQAWHDKLANTVVVRA
jgi:uncharacterized RDD family membrane protein YckC